MVVMGRKQKMVKRIIQNRRASESEEKKEKNGAEEVSPEEHEKRLRALKDAGLLK
jgi:hypothetical protein